jgi:hypothetical protein
MFAPAYMGRKRRGASPFQRSCYADIPVERKHLKKIVIGPCTLRRTWGTRRIVVDFYAVCFSLVEKNEAFCTPASASRENEIM